MKKMIAAVLLVVFLTACGAPAKEEPTEVVIFAAASLEATLTEIAERYEAEAGVALVFNFDSSGTLRTQIKEGAVCDLFLSAGQKQMNELEEAGLVRAETRVDLVENRVVLAVPEENPADIQRYADLATEKLALLCIGNEDVPVGSYSLEILKNLEIDLTALEQAGKVTYGSNVTEVATQVKEGAVDCGIVYATDAFTHGLRVVDQATPELCGQVIYPAALITSGAAADAAQAFLNYLRTDDAAVSVLESVGFTVLP